MDKWTDVAKKRLETEMSEEMEEIAPKEEDIVLLSCEECDACKDFEDLLTALDIGRIINVNSDEGRAYLEMSSFEPGDYEYLTQRGFHPLLIANTYPQVQFTKIPPDEEIIKEWYELFYLQELESEE